jgi:hypothetical protein
MSYVLLFNLGLGKVTGAFSVARFVPDAEDGSPKRAQSLSVTAKILQPVQWSIT